MVIRNSVKNKSVKRSVKNKSVIRNYVKRSVKNKSIIKRNVKRKVKRNVKRKVKRSVKRKSGRSVRRKKYLDGGNPGLLIDDTLITRISGPVNLSILNPTKEFHKSHKAPIFILFGDEHFSSENMCDECLCIDKSCCYEIFSNNFLKLIDNVATKHIVYFSTESGLSNKDKSSSISIDYSSDDGPLTKLIFNTQLCSKVLKKEKPSDYELYCPTKHIIWQKADVRQWYRDYDFYTCLLYMNELFDIKSFSYGDEDKIYNFCEKYSDYIIYIKKFLDIEFYNTIKLLIKSGKIASPFYKQVEKMTPEKQKEWNKYIDEYYLYYHEKLRKISSDDIGVREFFNKIVDKMNLCKNNKKTANIYVKSIKNIIYENKFQSEKIANELLEFNSLSLDLYFLTRSFKTTADNTNPLISIGYFGDNHRIRIEYFLKNIMKNYEVLDIGVTNEKQRCLEIKKHINLNEMINKLIE